MTGQQHPLWDADGIESRYDYQRNYDTSEDRYPPDWDARRNAVYRMFDFECCRCKRDIEELDGPPNVHHVRPLSDGGTNKLVNLVLLCTHCHDLVHGHSIESGDYWNTPVLPHPEADERVAIVRKPVPDVDDWRFVRPAAEVRTLLDALESVTDAPVLDYGVNQNTFAIPLEIAKETRTGLEEVVNRYSSRSAAAIVAENHTDRSRTPEEIHGVHCPCCNSERLSGDFAAFRVVPTNRQLTISVPDSGGEFYPVCPSCAKILYQTHDQVAPEVVCFGDVSELKLKAVDFVPTQIQIHCVDPSESSEGTLTLRVTDEDGQPIEGAILDSSFIQRNVTDERGKATVELIPDPRARATIPVKSEYRMPTLTGSHVLVDEEKIDITATATEPHGSESEDETEGPRERSHSDSVTDSAPTATNSRSQPDGTDRSQSQAPIQSLSRVFITGAKAADRVAGKVADVLVYLSPLLVWFSSVPGGVVGSSTACLFLLLFALAWAGADSAEEYRVSVLFGGLLLGLYLILFVVV